MVLLRIKLNKTLVIVGFFSYMYFLANNLVKAVICSISFRKLIVELKFSTSMTEAIIDSSFMRFLAKAVQRL